MDGVFFKEIVKLVVKSESGYWDSSDPWEDRLTITADSFKYDFRPKNDNSEREPIKWTIKTTETSFAEFFERAAAEVALILKSDIEPFAEDAGRIVFQVFYADGTKEKREFFQSKDEFRMFYEIVRDMLPACAYDFLSNTRY